MPFSMPRRQTTAISGRVSHAVRTGEDESTKSSKDILRPTVRQAQEKKIRKRALGLVLLQLCNHCAEKREISRFGDGTTQAVLQKGVLWSRKSVHWYAISFDIDFDRNNQDKRVVQHKHSRTYPLLSSTARPKIEGSVTNPPSSFAAPDEAQE